MLDRSIHLYTSLSIYLSIYLLYPGKCDVLFKPTKSTSHPFRATGEEAMSYLVGAEAMKMDAFKGEDAGSRTLSLTLTLTLTRTLALEPLPYEP